MLFVSFPSAKDPRWLESHPGTATIEVVSLADYDLFAKWEDQPIMRRDEDYQALKKLFQNSLERFVLETFPQLQGRIVHSELSTPLSTRHYMNYSRGEIYGIDHRPERFRQSWLRPRTEIKGYFLSGQDILTDGVTGAMMSGVLTASAVSGKNLIKGM